MIAIFASVLAFGHYADRRVWQHGFGMAAIGTALLAFIIALGG